MFSVAPANARDSVIENVDVVLPGEKKNVPPHRFLPMFFKAMRIHLETYNRMRANGEKTIGDYRKPEPRDEGPEL